jgi:hypothetical protein
MLGYLEVVKSLVNQRLQGFFNIRGHARVHFIGISFKKGGKGMEILWEVAR